MTYRTLLTGIALAFAAMAQGTPSFDPRLSVSTIVREDPFAGFLANDMERLARGEKNIEVLLQERPVAKAQLLSWKGGATLYRAVVAHERKQPNAFDSYYKQALALFAEASQLAPSDDGVGAITGGSYALFMDRVPEKHRAAAATAAYDAYRIVWAKQSAAIDKMPLHFRGELLAGLAVTAQRTGRAEETAEYLDRMIATLANSPYESRARKWKENPGLAERTTLVCVTCHDAGKLEARKAALAATKLD